MSPFSPFDPPTHIRWRQEATGRADLTAAARPVLHFGGYQHVPLREGWIAQGLQALSEAEQRGDTSQVFAVPQAIDRFGLEPAMVPALRFWLRATGVMEEQPGPGVRRLPLLTPLGRLLQQADSSLEHPGSAWLLHAQLARNGTQAPLFSWFFQRFARAIPFTTEACVQAAVAWASTEAPDQEIRPAAIRADLTCLLHMYLPEPPDPPPTPASLGAISPFRRLGLLCLPPVVPLREGGLREARLRTPTQYRLYPPGRAAVPALIVLAALLEHGGRQVLLRDLLAAPLHIGRTFGLTQEDVWEAFARVRACVPAWCPSLERIGRQAWVRVPVVPIGQVLRAYYASSSRRPR